jgi:hypothetical protein
MQKNFQKFLTYFYFFIEKNIPVIEFLVGECVIIFSLQNVVMKFKNNCKNIVNYAHDAQ